MIAFFVKRFQSQLNDGYLDEHALNYLSDQQKNACRHNQQQQASIKGARSHDAWRVMSYQPHFLLKRPMPWHGPPRCQTFFLPGPAKYQMIKPTKGSTRMSTIHRAFSIGFAALCNTLMIAQISSINTTSQSNFVIAVSSSC